MTAWRYSAVSSASLLGAGGLTYWLYGLAVVTAHDEHHRWVVVLYVIAATALLGGLLCDRWQTIRDLVVQLGEFLASLVAQLAVEPESPLMKLQARIADSERRLAEMVVEQERLKERQAKLEEQARQDAERIEQLEEQIAQQSVAKARAVTGFALDGLGIVLGAGASVLWAANLA